MPLRGVLDTPGFAWWYLDVVDAEGTGLVLIWSFGLPFLPDPVARAGDRLDLPSPRDPKGVHAAAIRQRLQGDRRRHPPQ